MRGSINHDVAFVANSNTTSITWHLSTAPFVENTQKSQVAEELFEGMDCCYEKQQVSNALDHAVSKDGP